MNPLFLTLAEAAQKTGRSGSTIRRFIKSITDQDAHPDRDAVQPTPAQVTAFKKKGDNFAWKIREDVLEKNFPRDLLQEKKNADQFSPDVLKIIQRELDLKNQQIEKQWDVIQSLNDRLREGNILMGSLQQRLALPSQESSVHATVDAPPVKSSTESSVQTPKEAAVKAFKKVSAEASKKAAKKGFFSWFKTEKAATKVQ